MHGDYCRLQCAIQCQAKKKMKCLLSTFPSTRLLLELYTEVQYHQDRQTPEPLKAAPCRNARELRRPSSQLPNGIHSFFWYYVVVVVGLGGFLGARRNNLDRPDHRTELANHIGWPPLVIESCSVCHTPNEWRALALRWMEAASAKWPAS